MTFSRRPKNADTGDAHCYAEKPANLLLYSTVKLFWVLAPTPYQTLHYLDDTGFI